MCVCVLCVNHTFFLAPIHPVTPSLNYTYTYTYMRVHVYVGRIAAAGYANNKCWVVAFIIVR